MQQDRRRGSGMRGGQTTTVDSRQSVKVNVRMLHLDARDVFFCFGSTPEVWYLTVPLFLAKKAETYVPRSIPNPTS